MKKEKIILILFLAFIFIMLVTTGVEAITINGKTLTGETITGKAPSQPTNVSIQVFVPLPTLTLISPKNKTYLTNNSLLLNYTSNYANKIWYNLDNSTNTTITSSLYFNTSQGSHTLYLYANNSDGNTSLTYAIFSVNSTKFTILYEEYETVNKGNSTDFNMLPYEELQNLSNILLENIQYGKILFNEAVNLTEDSSPNDSLLDLDDYQNISFNRIELNSTALPNFNKLATLWLYNLNFSNPHILRDGAVCPSTICTKESYNASSGTLKFNVTSFTVYSAEETPGEEEVPVSAGGGGGGGRIVEKIVLDKERINISLKQGETKKESIVIKNIENQKIKVELSFPELEDFIKISERSFELNAKEVKILTLDFTARENIKPDLYIEKIIVKADEVEKDILVVIEVESKKPLFDVEVEIPKNFLNVRPGEKIIANIKLFRLEGKGKVDVEVAYIVKNEQGETILSEHENRTAETETSFAKEIHLPSNIKYEKYIFYVKVTHDREVASSSAQFSVGKLEMPSFKIEGINLIMVVIVVALLFFVAYRLIKLKKTKEKLKENTFVKEKL